MEPGVYQKVRGSAKSAALVALAFSFFINLLGLGIPLYTMLVYNKILASYSVESLVSLTIVVTLAILALSLLSLFRGWVFQVFAKWAVREIIPEFLAAQLTALQPQKQARAHQALSDISQLKNFISSQSVAALFDLPWFFINIAVVFLMSWVLGAMTLAGIVILLGLVFLHEKLTYKEVLEQSARGNALSRSLGGLIDSSEVVVPHGMLKRALDLWQQKAIAADEDSDKTSRQAALVSNTVKTARMLLNIFVIAVGAYLVIHEQLSAGAMIGASILMSRALAPIEQLIGISKQTLLSYGALQRLKADLVFVDAARARKEGGQGEHIKERGAEISLKNVSFTIPGKKLVILSALSMDIKPADFLVIAGNSGAGLSTLVKVIAGTAEPTIGTVQLNGVDAALLRGEALGEAIGYLPQETYLFPGTIQENIARCRENCDSELKDLLKELNLNDALWQHQAGLNTEVQGQGIVLNQSFKRWICIARALFGNPRIIVMDDPFAHLDMNGEKLLLDILKKRNASGATVILATHSPLAVSYAGKLAILHGGRLVGFGPKDEILQKLAKNAPTATA